MFFTRFVVHCIQHKKHPLVSAPVGRNHLHTHNMSHPQDSWSAQQVSAINDVRRWLKDANGPQVFRLFGFAGTGKTTLAKELAANVGGRVVFACFTGKAAMVLRSKGCPDASTIHSLIYKAYQDPDSGEVEFILNPESDAGKAKLIVIDEVSMVGKDLANDLLSFGTRVLVLGDPFQLPPVGSEGYFINAKPDVMLTEVHRQAEENPIIRMSMDIREGRILKPGAYGESLIVKKKDTPPDRMRELVLAADQLLCGRNTTRQNFNARIRVLKGLVPEESAWRPVTGDRLVCLRNNHRKSLLNGGLWSVGNVNIMRGKSDILVSSIDEPDRSPLEIKVLDEFFTGKEKELDWKKKIRTDEFTYGWALTCHKAQGSQWNKTIIFNESHAFGEDSAKWLYTAITRAAESLTLVV